MHDLLWHHHIEMSLRGRINNAVYRSDARRIAGQSLSSWLGWLGVLSVVAALLLRFSWWVIVGLMIVVGTVYLTFWWARRAGYCFFVVDKTAVAPSPHDPLLPPDERIRLRATGYFAVSRRQARVLLRPADYWRTPLGEHAIMVEAGNNRYLYQFFSANMVETVQAGRLMFGQQPRKGLSLTFCNRWGPGHDDVTASYFVRSTDAAAPCQRRTIYLTFDSDAEMAAVWRALQARSENGD